MSSVKKLRKIDTKKKKAKKAKKERIGPASMQELSAFVEKHKHSRKLSDKDLKTYLDTKIDKELLEGLSFINLDSAPIAVQQFIDLQNRIAGREVGRSGKDSFHHEDRDASLGPETTRQRLKREEREFWWRWLLIMLLACTRSYEDTYKMLQNALEAARESHRLLDLAIIAAAQLNATLLMLNKQMQDEHKKLKKTEKELSKLHKKMHQAVKDSLEMNKKYEERLKQEKEDLEEYERDVLKPAEEQLNSTIPTEAELENIQENITRTMPGRPWRIFEKLMQGMKNKYNTFPRAKMIERRTASEPEPEPTPKTPDPSAYNTHNTENTEEPDAANDGPEPETDSSSDPEDEEEDNDEPREPHPG